MLQSFDTLKPRLSASIQAQRLEHKAEQLRLYLSKAPKAKVNTIKSLIVIYETKAENIQLKGQI